MQIARKNHNLTLIVRGYRVTESQIKTPKVALLEGVTRRKERKAQPQFRTRMTRIFTDPRASASTVAPVDVAHTYGSRHTWRFAFHKVCSSLKNPASGASVSAFIRVHLRFFKNRQTLSAKLSLSNYIRYLCHIRICLKASDMG